MESFSQAFAAFASTVSGIPLMLILFAAGILFTFVLRGLQFRKFGFALKHTMGKVFSREKAQPGELTPFQAMCTALAATIGTGSIAGVAGAIAIGGPGAVFWMWVSALFGMATKYAEITLSIHFREKNEKGDWVGGPMYSIRRGLGKKWAWLAGMFALCGAIAAFGTGNMTQINTITNSIILSVESFTEVNETANTVLSVVIGVVVAVLVGMVLLGGVKRIGAVTEKLIPTMCILYVVGSLVVIGVNYRNIGPSFAMIFKGAFNPSALGGGLVGTTILKTMEKGVGRGIFSNEAGLGSAPMAHSTANAKSPAEQGMFGIMEVFLTTMLICTMTAVTILSGGITINYGQEAGASLSTAAFATVMGDQVAALFMAVAISLFALSTILSWGLYGIRCTEFLFGTKSILPYKIAYVLLTVVGSVAEIGIVWSISDMMNCFMAIPNLIGLCVLAPTVKKITTDYFAAKKAKKESGEGGPDAPASEAEDGQTPVGQA